MIIIESTDDALVNPSHLNNFIEGRTVHHVWSHEATEKTVINNTNHNKLQVFNNTPNSAYVVWLKSGHEVTQECKNQIIDILDNIYNEDIYGDENDSEIPQEIDDHDENFNNQNNQIRKDKEEEAKRIRKVFIIIF